MKKLFLLALSVMVIAGYAQKRALLPSNLKNLASKEFSSVQKGETGQVQLPGFKTVNTLVEETDIGTTRYDDQSNASIDNRIYLFGDGTIGATWTHGLQETAYSDRGTGYNFFDGTAWGPMPAVRVEDERCGWPSFSPYGANGEIFGSHTDASGIKIAKRPQKGSGNWEMTVFPGPPDHAKMIWDRLITSGPDRNRIHLLAVTASTAYSGTPYLGLDGALVYSMSEDGGATWIHNNSVLDGMGSDYYTGYQGDSYNFAEPMGDTIAFVVGETWYDLYLMKSTDGGETFTKTLIWEHPYPFWVSTMATDTFYCADGSDAIALDNSGMVHVVFGINRAYSDGSSSYWFPFVDGIAYWNETMPVFSNDMNALSPYGDPGSELIEDYNLIGWTQDVDGDGQITFVGTSTTNIGNYYLGLSSMPQIVIDDQQRMFVTFASVTETYQNGMQNYRHIWIRSSPDCGTTWGDFTDLTSDIVHIFDECVYPSVAANSDDYLYLLYQADNEPGNSIWGDLDPTGDNLMRFMKILKSDVVEVPEHTAIFSEDQVSQNYPNPFSGTSQVNVILKEKALLGLEVCDLTGRLVYRIPAYEALPGLNQLTIAAGDLKPGVYYYTVTANDRRVTKKMLIE
jgi:hypothetical protein